MPMPLGAVSGDAFSESTCTFSLALDIVLAVGCGVGESEAR
jgi:hypothetical protein